MGIRLRQANSGSGIGGVFDQPVLGSQVVSLVAFKKGISVFPSSP